MSPKSQTIDDTMYKHSLGHYRTSFEANRAMLELLEKCPDLKLDIVREKRSNNTWAKYCVCEWVPFKRSKKSNDNKGKRGKQRAHPKSQMR